MTLNLGVEECAGREGKATGQQQLLAVPVHSMKVWLIQGSS